MALWFPLCILQIFVRWLAAQYIYWKIIFKGLNVYVYYVIKSIWVFSLFSRYQEEQEELQNHVDEEKPKILLMGLRRYVYNEDFWLIH